MRAWAGIAVGAALGLVAAVSAPTPAAAALPGRNGVVVFQSQRTHSPLLTRISAAGAGEKALPHDHAGDADPAWNAAGTRLAFERNADIWVEAPDGTGQVDLTPRLGNSGAPTWSPDGSQIAFAHVADDVTEIWVVDVKTKKRHQLTHDRSTDGEPAWSVRNTIAYTSYQVDNTAQLFVIHADGSGKTDLTRDTSVTESEPDWSPDGRTLIFTRSVGRHCGDDSVGPDLWTRTATGSALTPFCHQDTYSDGQQAVFSPSGKQVVFTANNGTGGLQLWVAPFPSADSERALTDDPGNPTNAEATWQPLPR